MWTLVETADLALKGLRSSLNDSGGFHVEHGLFGGLKHGIESANADHRQDHIAVLTADVQVAHAVFGNAPNKLRQPANVALAL